MDIAEFNQMMKAGEQYQRDVAANYSNYVNDPEGWTKWCAAMDEWRAAEQNKLT